MTTPEAYAERLLRAVPMTNDPVARELALRAVAAFVASGGALGAAAAQVDGLVRRLGTHHSRLGTRPEEFALSFAFAHRAAQEGLRALLTGATETEMRRTRERVADFVTLLASRATAALDRARAREANGGYSLDTLASALFRPPMEDARDLLAVSDELDRLPSVRVLVVVGKGSRTALPDVLLHLPGAVAGPGRTAVAVPVDETTRGALASVRRRLRPCPQIVVGSPTPWRHAPTSLTVVRRAAALLAEGVLDDERRLVPSIELAGPMLMTADPDLTDLLVRLHLAPLNELPAPRRVLLGEALLRWLESGGNDLSELSELRTLFDTDLDEPAHRLALSLALHQALPRWRAERRP